MNEWMNDDYDLWHHAVFGVFTLCGRHRVLQLYKKSRLVFIITSTMVKFEQFLSAKRRERPNNSWSDGKTKISGENCSPECFFGNFLCLSRTSKSKFCCKVNRVLNSSPSWWSSSLTIVSTINRSKSIFSPRSSKSTQLYTHLTKGVRPIPWCAAEAVDCGLSWNWNWVDQQLWIKLVYKLKVLLPKFYLKQCF